MKRILCISDIHGEYGKFVNLLDKIEYNYKNDQLILLGDYVDRGFDNIKTLNKIIKLKKEGAIVLKGNHEELAQGSLNDLINNHVSSDTINHISCGGGSAYNEFKMLNQNELIRFYNFIKGLPYIYEYKGYIFVHAGIDSSKPLHLNSKDTFIWSREEFILNKAYDNKIIIFGHTPTINMNNFNNNTYEKLNKLNSKIWYDYKYKDKIGIDCGSIFGGNLACLDLTNKKEYYI